jgi:hypothetical protein
MAKADGVAGLLEEKGVSKEEKGTYDATGPATTSKSEEHKEKVPLKEKIKDKLHLHRH